jgi:F0F1-type ATP synthase delta subunit
MNIDVNLKEELRHYLKEKLAQERGATITSVYQLTDDDLETIKKAFPPLTDFKIENIIDKKILGGIVIKFDTKVIDLSIAGQLKNFRRLIL